MIGAHLGAVRSLVLAVDAGSLSEAGRRLGLTPSAVSKQLTRLEAALGARLLERTTRRVRPTAAGVALVQRTRPLFEAFDEAGAAVRDLQAEVRGRVRVSASRAFGRVLLTPILARLVAEHPQLELDVVLDARRLDFIEDDLDLAVREGAMPDSSLTVRKLGEVAVRLYAAPTYLARRRAPRSLDDLSHHDLLAVPASGPASDVASLKGRNGRRLGLVPRIRVNDLMTLAELAERGAGIAVLPDYVAASRTGAPDAGAGAGAHDARPHPPPRRLSEPPAATWRGACASCWTRSSPRSPCKPPAGASANPTIDARHGPAWPGKARESPGTRIAAPGPRRMLMDSFVDSFVTPSVARVPLHTATATNQRIREEMLQRVDYYRAHPDQIGRRIKELNEEWDVERALATGSSCLSLLGLGLGLGRSRRWLALTLGVQFFYLQHAIQGWCPPLPLLRSLGFRTPMEIELERAALKEIREGVSENPVPPAGLDCGVGTHRRAEEIH